MKVFPALDIADLRAVHKVRHGCICDLARAKDAPSLLILRAPIEHSPLQFPRLVHKPQSEATYYGKDGVIKCC